MPHFKCLPPVSFVFSGTSCSPTLSIPSPISGQVSGVDVCANNYACPVPQDPLPLIHGVPSWNVQSNSVDMCPYGVFGWTLYRLVYIVPLAPSLAGSLARWVSVFAIIINQEFDLCHVTNFSNDCELFEVIYDRKTLTKCVCGQQSPVLWVLGSREAQPLSLPAYMYIYLTTYLPTYLPSMPYNKQTIHPSIHPVNLTTMCEKKPQNNGLLVGNFYYL